jgi:hypothetical protein
LGWGGSLDALKWLIMLHQKAAKGALEVAKSGSGDLFAFGRHYISNVRTFPALPLFLIFPDLIRFSSA